jgi:predicted NBD/HSP70 family sugar kinase
VRKINTRSFRLATRSTAHDVNKQIVLNLVREHQPISRAELARRMGVHRSALTNMVRELVQHGIIYERGTAATARGRRPTLLHLRTSGRLAVAVDVRPGRTVVALADFAGRVVSRDVLATPASPEALMEALESRVERLLAGAAEDGTAPTCEGVGLVVPGMVDRRLGRIVYAPRLGWRDVELRHALGARLGIPVRVEAAPIACAMARLWLAPEATGDVRSFAYVSVSEGVGVGIVISGEVLRGEAHTAGEFGHVSLDPNGPECVCGRRGCWEAFAGDAATLARYVERAGGRKAVAVGPVGANGNGNGNGDASPASRTRSTLPLTIEEVVRRARRGEEAAREALEETGTQIGRGLAMVVSSVNPGRIFVGGEVTAAWDVIEAPMRKALAEGTLTPAGQSTPVVPDGSPAEYRLLGAVALVAAPSLAAPRFG